MTPTRFPQIGDIVECVAQGVFGVSVGDRFYVTSVRSRSGYVDFGAHRYPKPDRTLPYQFQWSEGGSFRIVTPESAAEQGQSQRMPKDLNKSALAYLKKTLRAELLAHDEDDRSDYMEGRIDALSEVLGVVFKLHPGVGKTVSFKPSGGEDN